MAFSVVFDIVFFIHYISVPVFFFFFSSRRRHTRLQGDWSSDVCSSDLVGHAFGPTPWPGWNVAGVADFNRDGHPDYLLVNPNTGHTAIWYLNDNVPVRSEERRVGKECRSRWSPYH